MEVAVLQASDEAANTAYVALRIAEEAYERASNFAPDYKYSDPDRAAAVKETLVRIAGDQLATAREDFGTAVFLHSQRVEGNI